MKKWMWSFDAASLSMAMGRALVHLVTMNAPKVEGGPKRNRYKPHQGRQERARRRRQRGWE